MAGAVGALNLSGLWMGSYSYLGGAGPTTPFIAKIVDDSGALSGEVVEPNTVGFSSEALQAIVSGSRDGHAVDFTKVYDGASDAAHAVDYVGRVSADGNQVTDKVDPELGRHQFATSGPLSFTQVGWDEQRCLVLIRALAQEMLGANALTNLHRGRHRASIR